MSFPFFTYLLSSVLVLASHPPKEYYAVVIDAHTHQPLARVVARVTQADITRTVRTEDNGRFTLDVTAAQGLLHIHLQQWGYQPVDYDRQPYCSWPDTLAMRPVPPALHQVPTDY